MTSITLYNKGKRTWTDLRNSAGEIAMVKPEGSIEMEEAAGLRMLVDYPREFTSSKIAGPSSEDLARREQSLRDRTANLDAREEVVKAKESEGAELSLETLIKVSDTEAISIADLVKSYQEKAKRGPGRPKTLTTAATESEVPQLEGE